MVSRRISSHGCLEIWGHLKFLSSSLTRGRYLGFGVPLQFVSLGSPAALNVRVASQISYSRDVSPNVGFCCSFLLDIVVVLSTSDFLLS